MALHDALGDRETEPGAAGAAGEERVEDPRLEVGRDAAAGVDHIDGGERRAAAELFAENDRELAVGSHGVGGVEDEVKKNLLELTLVGVDHERGVRRIVAQAEVGLRELGADEDEGVADDIGERPAGVKRGGRFGEIEDAKDDGFELVDFFVDDAEIGATRVVFGEVETEAAVKEFDDGERIADLVGDLGGEEAEGGELLVFAELFFALENAGIEAGVLQGDGAQTGERGAGAFLVVVETVDAVRVNGENAENFSLVKERSEEDGMERGIARKIGEGVEAGSLDIEKIDGAFGADGGGEEAGLDGEVVHGNVGRAGGGAIDRDATHGALVGVVQEKCAELRLHHVARVARERGEELVRFEFGDERLAGGEKRFELVGFGAKVAFAPELQDDAGRFGGETFEEGEVGGRETLDPIAFEIEHADHEIAVDHRCGHFAASRGPDSDVTRLVGDVGNEDGSGVEDAPAGDAVAEFQAGGVASDRDAELDLGFEAAGAGIEEGDRSGVGAKRGDKLVENLGERGVWILGSAGERGEAVERRVCARIVGGGHGEAQ